MDKKLGDVTMKIITTNNEYHIGRKRFCENCEHISYDNKRFGEVVCKKGYCPYCGEKL